MHIVLDADAAPAGTVDARLDRNYRAFTERCFDGFRQTRRFVDLEAQSVAEAVPERVAVTAVLDVAASKSIGFLPLHARSHRLRRDGVGVTDDVIDLPLLGGRASDHHRPSDVGAVAFVLRSDIQ